MIGLVYTGTVDYMSFILLGTVLSQYLSAVLWGMGYSLKNEIVTWNTRASGGTVS